MNAIFYDIIANAPTDKLEFEIEHIRRLDEGCIAQRGGNTILAYVYGNTKAKATDSAPFDLIKFKPRLAVSYCNPVDKFCRKTGIVSCLVRVANRSKHTILDVYLNKNCFHLLTIPVNLSIDILDSNITVQEALKPISRGVRAILEQRIRRVNCWWCAPKYISTLKNPNTNAIRKYLSDMVHRYEIDMTISSEQLGA